MPWEKVYVDVSSMSIDLARPASVVPKEWGLPDSALAWAGHRKGNGVPGDPTFIPLRTLAMMPFGHVVFFVLTERQADEEAFYKYTGCRVADVARLVRARRLVPQLLAPPGAHSQRFLEFFDPIREAMEDAGVATYHVNAYESAIVRAKVAGAREGATFADWKAEVTAGLPPRDFHDPTYEALAAKEEIMPKLPALRGWVGERVAWQLLEAEAAPSPRLRRAARSNARKLREAFARAPPVDVFRAGFLVHYTLTPKYYAKNGVTWYAPGEARDVAAKSPAFRTALNNVSARLDRRELRFVVPALRSSGRPPANLADQEAEARLTRFVADKFGDAVDAALRRRRAPLADASFRTRLAWMERFAQQYVDEVYAPAVRSLALSRNAVRVARVRALDLALNHDTIGALVDAARLRRLESLPSFEDAEGFFEMLKGFYRSPRELAALVEADLTELVGQVTVDVPRAQIGAELDPGLTVRAADVEVAVRARDKAATGRARSGRRAAHGP